MDNIYIERRSLSPDYEPDTSKLINFGSCSFSNKDKMLTRLMSDPNIDKAVFGVAYQYSFRDDGYVYMIIAKTTFHELYFYINSDNIFFNNMCQYLTTTF